jgi:hypothetical protein
VQLRDEGAQSPRSAKKGFHTFPRRERGLGMDAGGFWTGQDARLAGISRISQPLNLGFYNRLTGVIMDGLSQG